jgi:hypothetical protein
VLEVPSLYVWQLDAQKFNTFSRLGWPVGVKKKAPHRPPSRQRASYGLGEGFGLAVGAAARIFEQALGGSTTTITAAQMLAIKNAAMLSVISEDAQARRRAHDQARPSSCRACRATAAITVQVERTDE